MGHTEITRFIKTAFEKVILANQKKNNNNPATTELIIPMSVDGYADRRPQ